MRLPWQRGTERLREQYNQLFERGDFDQASRILQRIIEREPETAWAWFDLGLLAKWRRDSAQSGAQASWWRLTPPGGGLVPARLPGPSGDPERPAAGVAAPLG